MAISVQAKLLASTLLLLVLLALGYSISTISPLDPTLSWLTNTPSLTETIWTPTLISITPTDTPTPSLTASASMTLTPTRDDVPPTNTPTLSPSLSPNRPATTPTPTKTPQPPTNLQACLNTPAATCPLDHNLVLDTTLTISATGVTLVCSNGASITNAPSHIGSVLEIHTGTVEGCLIYRTLNTATSCCADTVSIVNASGVIFRRNTVLWGIDGTLDISNCDDCLIEQNIIAESLHCSTHRNGCHSFLSLVRDSRRVRFVHNLLVSAKARMAQFQNCKDCAFLNNVVSNYDGNATQVTFCSEVDYANNFGLRGLDTDPEAYLIRTPNLTDLPEGACRPKVFLANNSVDWYRVTHPGDVKAGVYVFSPLTAYYPLEDVWDKDTIIENAGAASVQSTRVRECVKAGTCVIRNVPIG